MITLSIPSSLNELDKVMEFVKLGQELAEGSIEYWMELLDTVQKIFTNIVKYAFPTCYGIVKINLNYNKEQQAIEVSFFDEGNPYNPLEGQGFASYFGELSRIEDDFGISLMEKTSYVYLNKKNITTVKKYLN
jgi:sigma-B regulation protein RsbU (phosphoserine phosphatase)